MTVFYHSLNIKASKFCDMQHNISFVDKKTKNKYNILYILNNWRIFLCNVRKESAQLLKY